MDTTHGNLNAKHQPANEQLTWNHSEIISIKFDSSRTIEYVNEKLCELSEYEEYELIGKPIDLLWHNEMPEVILKLIWDNVNAGTPTKAVVKAISKTGKYFWVLVIIEESGKQNGAIAKHHLSRWMSIPEKIIRKLDVLYLKLIQIERFKGIAVCEKFLLAYFEENQITYPELMSRLCVSEKLDSIQLNAV